MALSGFVAVGGLILVVIGFMLMMVGGDMQNKQSSYETGSILLPVGGALMAIGGLTVLYVVSQARTKPVLTAQ